MFEGEHHIPIPLGPVDKPIWENSFGYGNYFGKGTNLKAREMAGGSAVVPADPYGIDRVAKTHDYSYLHAEEELSLTGDDSAYIDAINKADREIITDMFSSNAPWIYKIGTAAVIGTKIVADKISPTLPQIVEPIIPTISQTPKSDPVKWKRGAQTLRVPPQSQHQFPYVPLGFTLNNSAAPLPGESTYDPVSATRKFKKRKKAMKERADRRKFLSFT